MEISLRLATTNELAAVNRRYNEINFMASYEGELIVLASHNKKVSGQGRVIKIDAESGELGGIYIFPGNEGLGIARKVVDFLIKNSKLSILYCLPFAELKGFYSSMGFKPVTNMDKVPETMIKKHQWCNANYNKPVLLLELRK